MAAVKTILKYLKGITSYGVWHERGKGDELIGWSDSNYAWDLDDRKNTSGFVFMIGSRICLCHQRSNQLSHYPPLRHNSLQQLVLIVKVFDYLEFFTQIVERKEKCITIYCDNSSSTKLSKNPICMVATNILMWGFIF
jgi:hypothetical protein